jgi:hypothetical protein
MMYSAAIAENEDSCGLAMSVSIPVQQLVLDSSRECDFFSSWSE